MRVYRLISLAFSLLVVAFVGQADNTSKEMNAIKRAADQYFYAESTMPTEKEAMSNAENLLISNINSYFEEAGAAQGFTPNMVKAFKYMKMKRGSDIRVLAYVSKEEIGLAEPNASAQKGEVKTVVAASKPIGESSKPVSQATIQKGDKNLSQNLSLTRSQEEIISSLLEAQDMQSAMKLLDMYKAMHKVKRFGTVKDAPENACPFWLIGNREFKVETVITGGDNPVDILTGVTDKAENHKGVPMLWFNLW